MKTIGNFIKACPRAFLFTALFPFIASHSAALATKFVPANHPHIQYWGRWDLSDSLHAKHSWPGVALYAEFSGTSIGVRMADNGNYYNVYLDGTLHHIFHGTAAEESDYLLVDSLKAGKHTLLLTKRNCAQNKIYSFSGFLLDAGAQLLPPASAMKTHKIEFIGDSFTVAEGNEATVLSMPWEETFPVTNLDKGFAVIVARHFNAQYHITARSGIGMVTDWSGDHTLNMPDRFDRALMDAPEPKWDFQRWAPELVVICLGLNDYSGLKDQAGNVSGENSTLYRKRYHEFLATIRRAYPGVNILAVAAHVAWMRENVQQVVNDERKSGKRDIYFAQFDYFQDGYVANGHPNVASHEKIALQLISALEADNLLSPR